MRFWHAVWLFERDRPQGSPLKGDLRDGVALDHGEAAAELLAKGRIARSADADGERTTRRVMRAYRKRHRSGRPLDATDGLRQHPRMTDHDVTTLDLAALQGGWRQVRCEADGVVDPVDELSGGVFTFIEGTRFSVRTVEGELLLAGSFVLDATTSPKSVTWVDSMGPDAGKQLPAIYVVEGDDFTFIAAYEGASRPTEFRAVEGLTMRTFVRDRHAPPSP